MCIYMLEMPMQEPLGGVITQGLTLQACQDKDHEEAEHINNCAQGTEKEDRNRARRLPTPARITLSHHPSHL